MKITRNPRGTVAAVAAAGIAATSLAAVTTTLALTAQPAATAAPAHVLRLSGVGLQLRYDGFVDVNGDGPGIGDEMIVADTMYNHAGKHVGMARGVCTITHGNPNTKNAETNCVGTMQLNGRGRITFQGIEHLTKGNSVICAVTGGTGRYDGASGWLRVVLHGKKTSYTFHLRG